MKSSTEDESETETNSGVEFPGESIEPILGAATNLEDDTLEDSTLVVEVSEENFPFAFKYRRG